MLLEPGAKALFIGDSITDSGRRTTAAPYGFGFVSMIRNLVTARYPRLGLTFVNKGVDGHTVRDLEARWERDVNAERPHWLTVMIGINDVYHQFHGDRSTAVLPGEYADTLRRLVTRTRTAWRPAPRLILMTPYMMEPDRAVPMRRQMDAHGRIVLELARETGARGLDVQAAFDRVLRAQGPEVWAPDRFHPEGPGHAVIAGLWLDAVGFGRRQPVARLAARAGRHFARLHDIFNSFRLTGRSRRVTLRPDLPWDLFH